MNGAGAIPPGCLSVAPFQMNVGAIESNGIKILKKEEIQKNNDNNKKKKKKKKEEEEEEEEEEK